MIPMNRDDVVYYVGSPEYQKKPLPVYSELVCEFLNELSVSLRGNAQARQYSDIMAFAFWCRKGNIWKLKEEYADGGRRFGRGLVFHVAPSNVPINFAYSLAFGMLAGNSNIVRVSGKKFEQVKIVCQAIRELFQEERYTVLREQNQIISYEHKKELNDYYSGICDGRVLWGGDKTIEAFRMSPVDTRCVELTFADRYSFAVFSEAAVMALDEPQLAALAGKFYNDTYLMDQNACSSPHLIVWLPSKEHKQGSGSSRFWQAVSQAAGKYPLSGKKVMDKYLIACEQAAQLEEAEKIETYGNRLYVVRMSALPEKMELLRGRFGLFYEIDTEELRRVFAAAGKKVQTCVYFGAEKELLFDALLESGSLGVDRIVPVGRALDIGVYWDGYDIIGSLSRKIELA